MATPHAEPVERVIPPAAVTRVGNPVLTWLLSGRRRAAKVGQHLVLLHVTGRRSGRIYSIPVGYHRQDDGRLLVLTNSGWRVNLRRGPTPVELTLLGRRVTATALLEEDPAVVAGVYARLIHDIGLARAGQRLGIRINVDRAPSREELTELAEREHLSFMLLEVGGQSG